VSEPANGKGTKVTVNQFRGQWYVHIREYMEDPDTGEWFPTKKGISIKSEHIDIVIAVLNNVSTLLTDIYFNEIEKILPEKQLNLFKEDE
jgi:hypothetical protein